MLSVCITWLLIGVMFNRSTYPQSTKITPWYFCLPK